MGLSSGNCARLEDMFLKLSFIIQKTTDHKHFPPSLRNDFSTVFTILTIPVQSEFIYKKILLLIYWFFSLKDWSKPWASQFTQLSLAALCLPWSVVFVYADILFFQSIIFMQDFIQPIKFQRRSARFFLNMVGFLRLW